MKSSSQAQTPGTESTTLSISHDHFWERQASELPDRVVIDNQEWRTDRLSEEARKFLAIYLADSRIVAQQKEILALAELGLAQIKQQFCQLAAASGPEP
jgi:hypothetical protein